MTRFVLAPGASGDIDEIIAYLRELPATPAKRIGGEIQKTLMRLAAHPGYGSVEEELSSLAKEEFRRFCAGNYVFMQRRLL